MANQLLSLDLRSYNREARSHQHDYHQLVLPVSGELAMRIGDREDVAFEGRLAVVAAGRQHEFSAARQNCFVVADIPAALAPELERLPPFIELDAALADYVRFLHRQLEQGDTYQTTQRQMLLLLVQLLTERFGGSGNIDRRILAARAYLDENFQAPVSSTELAAVAHLSVRQLGELFRRSLGMSPQQYLTEKRMQRAWQLLETSDLAVQQIADRVGYTSLSSFSHRFREHFGYSPRHFRRIGK